MEKSELTKTEKACSYLSLTSGRFFAIYSAWQGKQSILHITVMFYSDYVIMYEDLTHILGNKNLSAAS
jgi:hypothetical protein